MNCRKVSHLLSAYIDGELPGVEYRQIREHLHYCRECSTEYDGLLEMKRLLARMRVREPNPALPGMILQRVEREGAQRGHGRPAGWFQLMDRRLHEPVSLPQGLTLGACAVAAGILFAVHTAPTPQKGIQWMPLTPGAISPLAQPMTSAMPPLPSDTRQVDLTFPSISLPAWQGGSPPSSGRQPGFSFGTQSASAFQAPRAAKRRQAP